MAAKKSSLLLGSVALLACVAIRADAADGEAKPASCSEPDTPVDYTRKADLPAGVPEALGFTMAEAGEPFQATDVIMKKGLPWRRFISARKTGCRMQLNLEHGGIGLRHESFDLDLADGKWMVHKP